MRGWAPSTIRWAGGLVRELWFTLDTADPPRGALIQKARGLGAAIETQLLFSSRVELLDEEGAGGCSPRPSSLLPALLRTLRRYRPHQLTEPRNGSPPSST